MEILLNWILTLLLSLGNFPLELLPSKRFEEVRMIENITAPQQVLWKENNVIVFVVNENIWEYVISENRKTHVGQREPNEFIGIDNNEELLFCRIEHYIISSYDESSTKFTVRGSSMEKEFYFFETIRPVYMDREIIIATTAVDFLEAHYYEIDISSGEIIEVEKPKRKKYQLHIPKKINFKNAYVRNNQRYVIEDVFGNLYLVRR